MSSARFKIPEPTWAVAALIIAWGLLISQVRHHWGGESYYNFGWFVPPLAIWLFLRNLSQLGNSSQLTENKSPAPGDRWHLALSVLVLLPVVVFHALSEVNPFWRVPLWAQGCCFSAFTLILIHRYYGWAGIRASLFPLLFLSTMVPWPYRLELWIIQSLTEVVITLAVHGLHFLSYPVEMRGNVLLLGDITIGVNEACSGIRSLQALFMVTLFLGSLFGQSAIRRLLAVAVLPLIVIIVNTGRAIFLSTQVIVNGDEAYEYWHDPAGYIAFGVSMVLIYGAIELLNIGGKGSQDSQAVDFKGLAGRWENSRPSRLSVGYLVLPLLVFSLVEGWFRINEINAPKRKEWELALPAAEDPDIQYLDIHKTVESALGYSFGHRFQKTVSASRFIDVYYYGYTGDNKLSSVSSYGHAPTICMQSSGAELAEEFSPLVIKVDDLKIPFRHYEFVLPSTGESIQIFWTIWESRNMDIDAAELQSLNYKTQWIQLLKGRRDFSRQVVLASLVGFDNAPSAREEISQLLTQWINQPSN